MKIGGTLMNSFLFNVCVVLRRCSCCHIGYSLQQPVPTLGGLPPPVRFDLEDRCPLKRCASPNFLRLSQPRQSLLAHICAVARAQRTNHKPNVPSHQCHAHGSWPSMSSNSELLVASSGSESTLSPKSQSSRNDARTGRVTLWHNLTLSFMACFALWTRRLKSANTMGAVHARWA